jgi:hypothetical protein
MIKSNVNNNTVAIVVPLSIDNTFNESEKISLRHLEYYLGQYKIYFIVPDGTTLNIKIMKC